MIYKVIVGMNCSMWFIVCALDCKPHHVVDVKNANTTSKFAMMLLSISVNGAYHLCFSIKNYFHHFVMLIVKILNGIARRLHENKLCATYPEWKKKQTTTAPAIVIATDTATAIAISTTKTTTTTTATQILVNLAALYQHIRHHYYQHHHCPSLHNIKCIHAFAVTHNECYS